MIGTVISYDDAAFRATLTYFADTIKYPPALMQQFFTNGTSYISNYNRGALAGQSRELALYLMTGHLAALNDAINENEGSVPGFVKDATIDKVKVGLQPPPAKNQFQYWLGLTPWGQQLLPLLTIASAGGFFVGGRPEGLAFRRAFGSFGFGR